MPVKSQAQRRLMYAAEEGNVPSISKKIGEEFINASHGMKNLPNHISDDKINKFSRLKKYIKNNK